MLPEPRSNRKHKGGAEGARGSGPPCRTMAGYGRRLLSAEAAGWGGHAARGKEPEEEARRTRMGHRDSARTDDLGKALNSD